MAWAAFGWVAAAALVYVLWRGRGNSSYYDEWTWIEFRHSGLHSILGSYNQHLLALPIGIYQLLFHTVGIGHYSIYRLLAALGHLACVAAIFAFALRRWCRNPERGRDAWRQQPAPLETSTPGHAAACPCEDLLSLQHKHPAYSDQRRALRGKRVSVAYTIDQRTVGSRRFVPLSVRSWG